jgi:lantibiotic biosynthesis protein
MVRAPLLAAGAADRTVTRTFGGSLMPEDPSVQVAIDVASSDLAAALARTRPDDRKAGRLRGKLLRYLIRMSTRPTPFGLFAGVGLVDWGPATSLALAPEDPRTRTRPDMGWLLDLVASFEADPEVRQSLRVAANPAVMLHGGRAFLRDRDGQGVSVRVTGAVRRTLELAHGSTALGVLEEKLLDTPGATPEKVVGLLDELVQQGLLRFELRPPLTGPNPAAYVSERLAGIPAARAAADGLADLLEQLAAWDKRPLQERVGTWPGLLRLARAIHPTTSANLLQVDTALPLAGTALQVEVGAEAARAAELLLRLSPHPDGAPHLNAYRQAFAERYGQHREVPLLELVDADFGLGPPADHTRDDSARQTTARRRDQLLCELALDAHRNHRLVVELDDRLLERLQTWEPRAADAPLSLDLPVFVAAPSPAAIDAGDFRVIVGPNLGTIAAGRNLGRFADLLGPPALAALSEAAAAEAALAPDQLLAEVVYLPTRARSANVAVRPAVRTDEIVFDTQPGVADEHTIAVDELVVGMQGGRLVIRWPAGGMQVIGVQGHMLNTLHAHPAVRFLLEVAGDSRCRLAPFDWGAAAAFPFLPRVQCGRVVLALAQWQIDPAAGSPEAEPAGCFPDALAAWRARWSVPRHLYLAARDNRLLLDLDDPDQVELLRQELKGLQDGHVAHLQEALPGPSEAWLPAAEGGHMAEIVVPLTLRRPSTPLPSAEPAGSRADPVPARARLRPPGSDWLYLKLYGPQPFEDQIIAEPLRTFGEFVVNAGLADGWYFLRYTDPDPHLRIRFHGEAATLLGPLIRQVCNWSGELVDAGVRTRFAFDTYEREVERYGGDEGMRAAEAVFTADSPTAAEILRLSRDQAFPYDLTTMLVVSMDHLARDLGLSTEERALVYQEAAAPSPDGGQEYRRRKRELRPLLGQPGALAETPQGTALATLLAERRDALAPTAERLSTLEADGHLWHPRTVLCRSYLHLHANRLLGTNPSHEQIAHELLRRTHEGLTRAPVRGA